MKNKPIYVEILIESEMDKLWEATQTPSLHEQWDLRFSSITYLPKKENQVQEFLYKTNIGFGLNIEGWGKSVGSFHADDGSRTSSLHFGTDQSLSIIREGKGYWKYIPEGSTIKFLTQYHYEPQFGYVGKLFDQFIFRPLMGWGTALSFDVLKRWMETGETPSSQYLRFFTYWLISILFFFIWTYHGLIPKIIHLHPTEIMMTRSLVPMTIDQASWLVIWVGIVECLVGILLLLYSKKRWLFGLQILIFPMLTLSVVFSDSNSLIHPFNPLTFNAALLILSMIGYMVSQDIPTAKSCKRSR